MKERNRVKEPPVDVEGIASMHAANLPYHDPAAARAVHALTGILMEENLKNYAGRNSRKRKPAKRRIKKA